MTEFTARQHVAALVMSISGVTCETVMIFYKLCLVAT